MWDERYHTRTEHRVSLKRVSLEGVPLERVPMENWKSQGGPLTATLRERGGGFPFNGYGYGYGWSPVPSSFPLLPRLAR